MQDGKAACVPVPEADLHRSDRAVLEKNDVRPAASGPAMKPEAVAKAGQDSTYCNFRLGVSF
jgi:hypothetical protein